MGVIIPQIITSDRASGAQVIDGSARITKGHSQRLFREGPGSDGDRRTWTFSTWVKRSTLSGGTRQCIFSNGSTDSGEGYIAFDTDDKLEFGNDGQANFVDTDEVYRDCSAWYNIIWAVDTTQGSNDDRWKLYVNGTLVPASNYGSPSITSSGQGHIQSYDTDGMDIAVGERERGIQSGSDDPYPFDGYMSQVYFIDGSQLEPTEFGFTDLLTNTWRPKKYEGTFGTNGWWLPMDGNSPIGQDKSGRGNDFTPVNFGGSLSLDNPQVSGARPILNTLPGGTQAGVGVFGSKQNVGYAVTVYNDGGGNKYYIDGTKQATLTGLIRGATYTFDQSDSTNDTHPLVFGTTANGNNFNGSSVTGATAGTAGAATTITIPHDGPNTIYYHCSAHSGMGADITGITTNEKLADQYASHCVLALPLVGASDDVSTSIACTSTTKSMSNVGNAAASSDTSNFYTGSFEFDGSGDGISTADNTVFEFGSGDFTVECWVKQDDTSGFDVFVGKYGGSSDGEFILGKNGNTPTFYWQDSSGNANINATNFTGNTDSWYHIAGVREGDAFTLYVNGICENSTTDATTIQTTSNKLTIASEDSASDSPFDGYLQDVRIYKGVAKYSGTTVGTQYFIPPATSPDILPDTPSGVSGGSKLTKITDGAVSFDGTGDYLSLAASTDLNFGTGSFTIEGFFYKNAGGSNQTLVASQQYYQSGNDGNWVLRISNGNTIAFASYDATSNEEYSEFGAVNVRNAWYHFAFVREGTGSNESKFYLNGKHVGSMTVSKSLTDGGTNGIFIGDDGSGPNNPFNGFLSNVRIIKGTALYTSSFTPPLAPLTNVTNTKLLCCQSPNSASEAAVGGSTVNWLPTGYTYWTAGMSQNWAGSGGTTSNTDDYINVALPQSGKYYWETTLNNVGTYRVMGISAGAAGAGSAYTNNIFGFYYNGNPPLFLTKNASGTSRAASGVTHGASVGAPNWANGDILMWAYDATNDKIYMGRNGTWYNSGDPVAGTGMIIDTEDLSASSYYFKLGYTADSGSLSLTNVTSGNSGSTTYPEVNGDAAATNFNPFNTDINTVRGQETGYCTFNTLRERTAGYNPTFKDGNLFMDGRGDGTGTLSAQSGKFYFEVLVDTVGTADQIYIGVQNAAYSGAERGWGNDDIAAIRDSGAFYGTGMTGTAGTYTAGDTLSFAFDVDDNKLYIAKNGVYFNSGVPSQGTGFTHSGINFPGGYTPIVSDAFTGQKYRLNCGQKPFKFTPPDGFQPLNAANIRPAKVFARPDQYVKATLYTGDGGTKSITTGMTPDLVWLKSRSQTKIHVLSDTINGVEKYLCSNDNRALSDNNNAITAFNVNGFTVGSDSTVNASSQNYVAWTWKAGGNKNTFNVDDVGYASASAAGLDGGSLAVTGASVGTKQGFSIIKFASGSSGNKTLSHGLLETPTFILVKTTGASSDWSVYHKDLGGTVNNYLVLNTNAANATASNIWGAAVPTSSVFGINPGTTTATSQDCIAYLWHDVPGLQKFGKYEANGSTDGPYVELGFKPAVLILKNVDDTENWYVYDLERSKTNVAYQSLQASQDDAENTGTSDTRVDLLSSGFKLRQTNGPNTDGDTYIYAAWAAAPSIDLFGGGANAR